MHFELYLQIQVSRILFIIYLYLTEKLPNKSTKKVNTIIYIINFNDLKVVIKNK